MGNMTNSADATEAAKPLLEMRHVVKNFGGVQALVDASLVLFGGEIHALLGENGAGKSTLLKTLAGVHSADGGEIFLSGQPFTQGSTRASIEQGVAVIYQEPSLFPDLTLAENVFVGRQLTKGRLVDWGAMEREAAELFERLGIPLNPHARAKGLSIADQQIVEIAKALSTDARVIVMDEPTAALSAKEVDRLFQVARTLRDQGHAVVFVSHRLDEVFALCDRMTVMRDGTTVGTELLSDVTEADLVRLMVGRDVSELFPKLDTEIGDAVLEVSELGKVGEFEGITFSVRAGEILGIAGLVGSGRSEVVRAVFGVDKYDRGSVRLFGKPLPKGNAAAAMKAGMALVPEDRRQQGLLMPTAIARNGSLAILRSVARLGLIRQGLERKKTTEWVERLSLKFASISDPVEQLSGGNQQKVVLAKWLATEPKLLIVDEPTRGIDVGTKAEVHRLLSQKAKEGMAVIMVSSELPEVLGMSDRIIVMREGRIAGELSRQDASPEKVIMAATGAGSQA
jgi:rhamnose transport system ATP-binding protein